MTLSQGIRPYRLRLVRGLSYSIRPGGFRVRNTRGPRVSVLQLMHSIIYIIHIVITIYTVDDAFVVRARVAAGNNGTSQAAATIRSPNSVWRDNHVLTVTSASPGTGSAETGPTLGCPRKTNKNRKRKRARPTLLSQSTASSALLPMLDGYTATERRRH